MCALCMAPTTRLPFPHSKNGFTVFQKTTSVKTCATKSGTVVEGCQIPETGVMHLSFPVPNRKHTPDCSAPERSEDKALLSHQLRAETPLFEDTNIASVTHCGRCELSEGQLLEERRRFQIRQNPSLHPGSFADTSSWKLGSANSMWGHKTMAGAQGAQLQGLPHARCACQCPVFGLTRRWHQNAFRESPYPAPTRPDTPKGVLSESQGGASSEKTQVVFVPVCAVSEIPDFSFGILLTSSCPVPKLLQFLNKFVGESHVRPQKGVPHIQVQLPRKAFWPNHLSFSSVPVLKYGEYFRG